MKVFCFLLVLLTVLPALAAPATWEAPPDTGDIRFIAYWNGTPVTGHFPRYRLTAKLDPAQPTGGKLTLHIATGAVRMPSPDITRAIRGQAWFDSDHYPQASFVSTAITRQADGSLQLHGKLRIKGHEKTLVLPLELVRKDGKFLLSGELRLDRGDFSIGAGQWAGGDIVAHRVDVSFSFTLVPAD